MFSDTNCIINDMLAVKMFKQTDLESLKCTTFIISEKYYYFLFVDFQSQAWHRGVNIPDILHTIDFIINTITFNME